MPVLPRQWLQSCLGGLVRVLAVAWMSAAVPEQIHLSLTSKPDEIVVCWITKEQPSTSMVKYGWVKWDLNMLAVGRQLERYQYQGLRMREGYRSGFIHKVVIKDLPKIRQQLPIYYRVGDPSHGWSSIRSFRARSILPDVPIRFAFHADSDAGQAEKTACKSTDTCVSRSKTREVIDMMLQQHEEQTPIDLYLHGGDMSYADGFQDHWDTFGKIVENFTSRVPVVTAVGNHELENRRTYDPWLHRWRHLEEGNGSEYWHSFDYGPVHFVFLSTEHETDLQLEFLKEDLERADVPEHRKKVPWIVAIAHHPMYNAGGYNMGSFNQAGFAPLFAQYRVSLFLCGHCHNYERTYPLSQGKVTDWGSGKPENPYIHDIWRIPDLTKASELEQASHYCNWNDCRGGRQGETWCNLKEDNCNNCGGSWCSYNKSEQAGLSQAKDPGSGQWGTIHIIAGIGGRRGDQCPKMGWTHDKPRSNRGTLFFDADRSSLHMQYIDIRHDVIDEFKICSKPGCNPAPEIPLPPLPFWAAKAASPKPAPTTRPANPSTSFEWHDAAAGSSSPPARFDRPSPVNPVLGEATSAEHSDALTTGADSEQRQMQSDPFAEQHMPGSRHFARQGPVPTQAQSQEVHAVPREEDGDKSLPDYLEKHEPVHDVIDCPVNVTKVDLGGNVTTSNMTVPGCSMLPRDSAIKGNPAKAATALNDAAIVSKSWQGSPYFIPSIIAGSLGILVLILAGMLMWQYRKRIVRNAHKEAAALQFMTASELAVACTVDSSDRAQQPLPLCNSQFPSPLMSSTPTSVIPAQDMPPPYDINLDFNPPLPARTPRVYSYNMMDKK